MVVRAVPALTVLLVTLAAALPWALPVEKHPFIRHLLPLLPFVVLHAWLVERPSAVPALLAFASGLFIDTATSGPLGFWALLYLVGYVAAAVSVGIFSAGIAGETMRFACIVTVLGAATWAVGSLLMLRQLPVTDVAKAGIAATALYPMVLLFARAIAGRDTARPNPSLQRQS